MLFKFYSEIYRDREGEQNPFGEDVSYHVEAPQHIKYKRAM